MKSKYTLKHNKGEAYFQTIRDAIIAMYVIYDYDEDCDASFRMTTQEMDFITSKVEAGEYYTNGLFTLYICEQKILTLERREAYNILRKGWGCMEDMEKITVKRLIEWLKQHGHTSEEIVDCLEYITGGKEKAE